MNKIIKTLNVLIMVFAMAFTLSCTSFKVYAADPTQGTNPVDTNTSDTNTNDQLPKLDQITIPTSNIYVGDNINVKIKSIYTGNVQYKVWLYSSSTKAWKMIQDYGKEVSGTDEYLQTLKLDTAGSYKLAVWVKEAGTDGTKESTTDKIGKYDDEKEIDINCIKKPIPKIVASFDKFRVSGGTKIYAGSTQTVTLIATSKSKVQYNILMYSYATKKWTSITNGYTSYVNASTAFTKVTPKYAVGSYRIAVRVKAAGTTGKYKDSLGDYDDARAISITVVKRPIPSSGISAPEITTMYVGNDSDSTKINVRSTPSATGKIVGKVIGSTVELKVLGKKGNYYYVQTVDYDSTKPIKGYIRADFVKKVTPSSTYSMLINKKTQKLYVFKGNKLVRSCKVSTGNPELAKDATETPEGRFLLGTRGSSFGQDKGYICYNWIRFNYNFMLHSVLHNLDGSLNTYSYSRLGTKASHGCVRLPDGDIAWIYKNVPKNTLLVIK